MKVIFYTVKSAAAKVYYLTQAASFHFAQKEKMEIIVPDEKSLTFLDDLFWSHPKESFLPHSSSKPAPFNDLLYICQPEQALSEASFVFNLCPKPYTPHPRVKTLYELEDCSTPDKKKIFQAKFKLYQEQGHTLSNGSLT